MVGDPGVGKSEVLRAATSGGECLAPAPVFLGSRPAALQLGVLEALAAAVTQLATQESTVHRIGGVLVEAIDRLAHVRAKEMVAAVAGAILDIVKRHVGDEVGALLDDFITQVRLTIEQQISARISAASDGDVLQVLIDFCAEVQGMIAPTSLALSLDNLERMTDDDLRLLKDLVDHLPSGVQIRAAHSIPDMHAAERVRQLEIAGADSYHLGGLPEHIVAYWLAAERVGQDHLPKLMRVTHGFPLYIDAAIAHMRSGGRLDDLPIETSFARQTAGCFVGLTEADQRACLFLAALPDRPSVAQLCALLGVDQADWLLIEGRLWSARMFAVKVSGSYWFHEQRRRALWEQHFSADQRALSSATAVDLWLDRLRTGEDFEAQDCIDLVRLLAQAPQKANDHANVDRILALGHDELALLGALLELAEPQSDYAADAHGLIQHAQEAFQADGDLVAELRYLHERGLLHLATSDEAAVVIPTWGSAEAVWALIGQAANVTGRIPIPRIATLLFAELLAPALGDFLEGICGIGRSNPTRLSKEIRRLQVHRPEGRTIIGPPNPGVIIGARLGSIECYGAFHFRDRETAREARAKLRGANSRPFRQQFRVAQVLEFPHTPLPSRRFVLAAELCCSKRLGTAHGMAARLPLEQGLGLDVEMEQRAALMRALRELTSETERWVLGWQEPHGLVYFGDEEASLVATVSGVHGARRVQGEVITHGPFFRFELAKRAGLPASSRVRTITYRSSRPSENPAADVLNQVEKQLYEFNQMQTYKSLTVPMREQHIRRLLLEARDQRSSDARALLESGVFADYESRPHYEKLYVLLVQCEPRAGYVYGHEASIHWLSVPNSDSNEVFLHLVAPEHRETVTATPVEWARRYFGVELDPEERLPSGYGDAQYVLASMLGYRGQHVRFAEG